VRTSKTFPARPCSYYNRTCSSLFHSDGTPTALGKYYARYVQKFCTYWVCLTVFEQLLGPLIFVCFVRDFVHIASRSVTTENPQGDMSIQLRSSSPTSSSSNVTLLQSKEDGTAAETENAAAVAENTEAAIEGEGGSDRASHGNSGAVRSTSAVRLVWSYCCCFVVAASGGLFFL